MSASFGATFTEGSANHLDATNPWASGSFTIAGWFYRTGTSTQRNFLNMGRYGSNTDDYTARVGHADGSTPFAAAEEVAGTTVTNGTNTFTTSTWQHIAGIYTTTGANGIVDALVAVMNGDWANRSFNDNFATSRDITGAGSFAPTIFRIGAKFTGSAGFNGLIAEVGLWNRALSESDITTLQTYKPSYLSSGLIAYWSLDDAGGSTLDLTDSVGAADLTAYGVSYSATHPALSGGASVVNKLAGKLAGPLRKLV